MATTTAAQTATTAAPLPTCHRCHQGVREVSQHRGLLLCAICRLIAVVRARA